jgi:hypothetical protein
MLRMRTIIEKAGYRARNSGKYSLNKRLMAPHKENGFINAHITSKIPVISFRTGIKNLKVVRNGDTFSIKEKRASLISLEKLEEAFGVCLPVGRIKLRDCISALISSGCVDGA